MKNKKRFMIYGILAILMISLIFIFYPRSGALESLVLENYKTTEFTYGTLNIENETYTIAEDNNDKVEDFLNTIKTVKLKEVSSIKKNIKEVYKIRLYSHENSENLGFIIYDFKYIKIFGSSIGRHTDKIYEISNKKDRNLLKEEIESIKKEN